MKKYRISIAVILAVLLALSGFVAVSYAKTSVRTGEAPIIFLADQQLAAGQSQYDEPVLGGLFSKRAVVDNPDALRELGTLATATVPLFAQTEHGSRQEEYAPAITLTLWLEDAEIFSGAPEEYEAFQYTENGTYRAKLVAEIAASEHMSHAVFMYDIAFELDVRPVVLFSSDRARQGDILSVYVNRGFEQQKPTIKTALGTAIFLPLSADEFVAYVPVNYAQKLGKWDVDVHLGAETFSEGIIVTGRAFKEQHMTISQSTADATMNNPDGPKNWAERIKVLWDTYDEKKYWTDTFIKPCEGRISTEFGLYRYTNNNPVPTRHTGIDIAAPKGTPVLASNSGRVVRAEDIIYTGNTVVIEHGGGLKTYYYHMDTLDVKEGDIVRLGDIVGTVGSTGYSTGAHLHFEVKIGSHSLSPWEMFDGTSGMYYLSKEL